MSYWSNNYKDSLESIVCTFSVTVAENWTVTMVPSRDEIECEWD